MEKEIASIITVLDFEVGKVFQYKISNQMLMAWDPDEESCEEFLTHCGHNLQNCEWIVHSDSEIVSRKAQWTRFTK